MRRDSMIAVLVLGTCVAACQTQNPKDKAAEFAANKAAAKTVSDAAQRAAVSRPGVQVCRQVRVGIAEFDWIRGRVSEIRGTGIQVRLDSAGRFPQMLNGVSLAPGTVVWDEMSNWTPCSY